MLNLRMPEANETEESWAASARRLADQQGSVPGSAGTAGFGLALQALIEEPERMEPNHAESQAWAKRTPDMGHPRSGQASAGLASKGNASTLLSPASAKKSLPGIADQGLQPLPDVGPERGASVNAAASTNRQAASRQEPADRLRRPESASGLSDAGRAVHFPAIASEKTIPEHLGSETMALPAIVLQTMVSDPAESSTGVFQKTQNYHEGTPENTRNSSRSHGTHGESAAATASPAIETSSQWSSMPGSSALPVLDGGREALPGPRLLKTVSALPVSDAKGASSVTSRGQRDTASSAQTVYREAYLTAAPGGAGVAAAPAGRVARAGNVAATAFRNAATSGATPPLGPYGDRPGSMGNTPDQPPPALDPLFPIRDSKPARGPLDMTKDTIEVADVTAPRVHEGTAGAKGVSDKEGSDKEGNEKQGNEPAPTVQSFSRWSGSDPVSSSQSAPANAGTAPANSVPASDRPESGAPALPTLSGRAGVQGRTRLETVAAEASWSPSLAAPGTSAGRILAHVTSGNEADGGTAAGDAAVGSLRGAGQPAAAPRSPSLGPLSSKLFATNLSATKGSPNEGSATKGSANKGSANKAWGFEASGLRETDQSSGPVHPPAGVLTQAVEQGPEEATHRNAGLTEMFSRQGSTTEWSDPFVGLDGPAPGEMASAGAMLRYSIAHSLHASLPDREQGVEGIRAQFSEGRVSATLAAGPVAAAGSLAAQIPSMHQFLGEQGVSMHRLQIEPKVIDQGGSGMQPGGGQSSHQGQQSSADGRQDRSADWGETEIPSSARGLSEGPVDAEPAKSETERSAHETRAPRRTEMEGPERRSTVLETTALKSEDSRQQRIDLLA